MSRIFNSVQTPAQHPKITQNLNDQDNNNNTSIGNNSYAKDDAVFQTVFVFFLYCTDGSQQPKFPSPYKQQALLNNNFITLHRGTTITKIGSID